MTEHEKALANFMVADRTPPSLAAARTEIRRQREALAKAETENARLVADLAAERTGKAVAVEAEHEPDPDAPRFFVFRNGDTTHYGVYDPDKNRYFTSNALHRFGNPESQLNNVEWSRWVACRPKPPVPDLVQPDPAPDPRDIRDRMDDLEDAVAKLAGRLDAIEQKTMSVPSAATCPHCGSRRGHHVGCNHYRCLTCGNAWEVKS